MSETGEGVGQLSSFKQCDCWTSFGTHTISSSTCSLRRAARVTGAFRIEEGERSEFRLVGVKLRVKVRIVCDLTRPSAKANVDNGLYGQVPKELGGADSIG